MIDWFYKVFVTIFKILVIFAKSLLTIIVVIIILLFALFLNRGCASISNPDDLTISGITIYSYPHQSHL